MGIHDFDLARWFMGDVDTVLAAGAVLAYPEMASIGDIDNAIATLVFRGLYDGPPLLLAVGLGGITGFLSLKLWRLVRRTALVAHAQVLTTRQGVC